MTEKHSSLTGNCFSQRSANGYAALAGQYKEPHHTGDIRIMRLSGSTTAKAALFSGHEVLDGNGVSVSQAAETLAGCRDNNNKVIQAKSL